MKYDTRVAMFSSLPVSTDIGAHPVPDVSLVCIVSKQYKSTSPNQAASLIFRTAMYVVADVPRAEYLLSIPLRCSLTAFLRDIRQ